MSEHTELLANVVEACRQRAIALFQAYARGVMMSRGGDENDFMADVEAFVTEIGEAYAPLAALSTGSLQPQQGEGASVAEACAVLADDLGSPIIAAAIRQMEF